MTRRLRNLEWTECMISPLPCACRSHLQASCSTFVPFDVSPRTQNAWNYWHCQKHAARCQLSALVSISRPLPCCEGLMQQPAQLHAGSLSLGLLVPFLTASSHPCQSSQQLLCAASSHCSCVHQLLAKSGQRTLFQRCVISALSQGMPNQQISDDHGAEVKFTCQLFQVQSAFKSPAFA